MEIIGLDSETTGLGPTDRAFGASWFQTGRPFGRYIDLRRDGADELIDLIESTTCPIVCHNASFDFRMLRRAGVVLPLHRLQDTVIRATLIDEHLMTYSLETLCQKYLGEGKVEEIYVQLANLFGGRATKNVQMPRISQAPPEMVEPYAIRDARLCHDLWQWQEKEIARQGIQGIVDFELRVMPSIIRNEVAGVRVDEEAAHRAIAGLDEQINLTVREVYDIAGKSFNIDSPKQVGEVFKPVKDSSGGWMTRDGHSIPSTPGGAPSFSAESLRQMNTPLATGIIAARSMVKTRDTFLYGHILGSAVNGRVYPSIHQTKGDDGGTGTGRLSYTSPALQQIPSRNKAVAAIIKPIFLPDEGQVWVDADMHSFEVRVFAHLVNNPRIIEAYHQNPLLDFHQFVAELTGLPRSATYSGQANAKQLNLSMIFNSGRGAIADKMGMPYVWKSFEKGGKDFRYREAGPEANAVIDQYHLAVPGVKELAARATDTAKQFGYVSTKFGRRLRFPRGEKLYKASGLCIQATSADINKMNWLLIQEALGSEGRLVLNTHDSYGMSMPEDWAPHWQRVKATIENGFDWFRVPLILELSGAGANWWDAIKKG